MEGIAAIGCHCHLKALFGLSSRKTDIRSSFTESDMLGR